MQAPKYRMLQPVVVVQTPSLFRFLAVALIALFKCSTVCRVDCMVGKRCFGQIHVLVVPELVWERRSK